MIEIEPRDDRERELLAIPHLSDEMKKEIIEAHRQRLEQFEEKLAKWKVEMGTNLQTLAEETSRKNAELRLKADQIIDDAIQRAGRDITAALEKVEATKRSRRK